ncbi:hypothetical protein [Nocardia sp. NPDC048505]|uniref:effector-associated constant component EACC1 n=1 Tax=unclassified Nocardia TaxID=2637762 RepID=UPI0033E6B64E
MRQLKITINPSVSEDLVDLLRWMTNEQDPNLHPERVPVADPDSMGFAEYLEIALASAGAGGLVTCLGSWIRYRRPQVTVSVETPDGTKVRLSAENLDDDHEIVKAIARLVDDEPESA